MKEGGTVASRREPRCHYTRSPPFRCGHPVSAQNPQRDTNGQPPLLAPGQGRLTEQQAEWRVAGREGEEEVQQADAGVSDEAVVIGSPLLTAQLLQPPLFSCTTGAVHQGAQKRLRREAGGELLCGQG